VPPRFYAPSAARPGDRVELPDDEAAHLTRVMRLGRGDAVQVFDGTGRAFEAIVDEVLKRRVIVRLGEPAASAREARVAVTLAMAVLKGDHMDQAIRDAVMLGAAAIQPIVTTRTEAPRVALARGGRRSRWQAIAVSATKQCGRAVVPVVSEPRDLDAVLTALPPAVDGPAFVCVEPKPGATPLGAISPGAVPLREVSERPPRLATVLIGPEGGWAADEVDRAVTRCQPVTLGDRVIRADAMPAVILTALFTRWGEF